ncbi:adenosine deaminase [Catenovulum sp. SX2]|uniref:adenosine deaminase n=1 Tax=Catenovulum sp. SX2 TaxID=3398614 RepID=UPI003F86566C
MKKLGLVLGLTLLASGCASVMTAEQQTINVTTSNSQQVEVTVDDKTITAPGMVTVLRDGKDKVVKTSGEGCDATTPIKKSITPVFFGNIVLGGLLGSTTDGLTGKMWNYADDVQVKCAG